MSKGELVTNCFRNKYTLQASTLQMSVLLAFNEADSWTVDKLAEATQIKMDILIQVLSDHCRQLVFCKFRIRIHDDLFVQVLQILLKSKLLVGPNPEAMDIEANIAPDATINIVFLPVSKDQNL